MKLVALSGWFIATLVHAQSLRVFTAPSVRVSVVVHEDLDPDLIRSMARPDVTLWLQTRSNTLRSSTLENLARFDEAFVRLRAPLAPVDARVFATQPRLGVWVELSAWGGLGHLLGPRKLAIDYSGPLDEAATLRIAAARPTWFRWELRQPPNLLEWGHFLQLPGRKIMAVASPLILPTVRCLRPEAGPSAELDVAQILTPNSDLFPCGSATRVVIRPDIDHSMLQALIAREPSVELVISVEQDEIAARQTKLVLDLLGRTESR